jgi:hypothetical protein
MRSSPSICSLVAAISFIVMGASFRLAPVSVFFWGGPELCFRIVREPELQEWVNLSKPEEKKKYPLTPEMLSAIDRFYFNHYCQIFRSGAFARANSSMYVHLDLYLSNFISRLIASKPDAKHVG